MLSTLRARDLVSSVMTSFFRFLSLTYRSKTHLRVHEDAIRKNEVEPLDELVEVVALLVVAAAEDVQIVLLQVVPLNLCLVSAENDYDQSNIATLLVVLVREETRIHNMTQIVPSNLLRLLSQEKPVCHSIAPFLLSCLRVQQHVASLQFLHVVAGHRRNLQLLLRAGMLALCTFLLLGKL